MKQEEREVIIHVDLDFGIDRRLFGIKKLAHSPTAPASLTSCPSSLCLACPMHPSTCLFTMAPMVELPFEPLVVVEDLQGGKVEESCTRADSEPNFEGELSSDASSSSSASETSSVRGDDEDSQETPQASDAESEDLVDQYLANLNISTSPFECTICLSGSKQRKRWINT